MFNSKEKRIEVKLEEHEVCADCGAFISKINKVIVEVGMPFLGTYYYCGKCKKPYDKQVCVSAGMMYKGKKYEDYTNLYFSSKEREVDEMGNLIKVVNK